MLRFHLSRSSPKVIELRSGTNIILSSHPHDMMTFFGVFLRKDYRAIESGSVVIDIGANIGMFSLYAALSGAKIVYAFGPSQVAFQILSENIRTNNLTGKIIPINKTVSNVDGSKVKFPIQKIDLLKLDCEGAEFDILPSLSERSLNKVDDKNGNITAIRNH